MRDGLIVWPLAGSASDDEPPMFGWARVAGGAIVQRGEGEATHWRAATNLVSLPQDDAAMFIAPAGDVAMHWIACPGMTVAQGAAAAPLIAREASIGPADDLHAAVAPAPDPGAAHLVAVASRAAMERWLGWCAAAGLSDAAIVPAPALVPPPDEGFVAARIGPDVVLRGVDSAFPADAALEPLIVGDLPVRTLSDGEIERALLAALAEPPLDLRQGSYARRSGRALDPAWLRRIAVLAAVIALVSLAIGLLTIARLHGEAAALDTETVALAQKAVPGVTDAADAELRLAGLVAQRGGAGGLGGAVAGLMGALQATPTVALTSLSQSADGSLRAQLSGPGAEPINAVLIALQNAGWRIAANGVRQNGAQTVADITVASW